MTNRERFAAEIEAVGGVDAIALVDDEIVKCREVKECNQCFFNTRIDCGRVINEWLNREAEE